MSIKMTATNRVMDCCEMVELLEMSASFCS